MDGETIVLVSRSVERLLIMSLAGMSILCGVYLLVKNVSGLSDAEWKSQQFSLKIVKVSPGIFFGLFGAVILVIGIQTQVQVTNKDGQTTQHVIKQQNPNTSAREIVYAGGNGIDMKKVSQARNTVTNFINRKVSQIESIPNYDKNRLKEASDILLNYQVQYLMDRFKEDFTWYNDIVKKGQQLKEGDEQQKFQEIHGYAHEEIE